MGYYNEDYTTQNRSNYTINNKTMAKETLNLEVKSNIKSVTKDTDKLGESLGKAVDKTETLEQSTKDVGKAAKGSVGGVKALGKGFGSLIKAVGIIGLLSAAFTVLKDVFGKNQKVVDAFNTVMTALNIVFSDLFKFLNDNVGTIVDWFKDIFENPKQSLIDFGDAIKENLIERFTSLLEVFGFLGKALKKLMAGEFGAAFDAVKEAGKEMVDVYTGVDDSVDKLTETLTTAGKAIVDYGKNVVTTASDITELNKAAQEAGVTFAMLNAQYLKQAEEQRQIRDDVTKTFSERIAANEELSAVLKKQQKLQKEALQTQVDSALALHNIDKTNLENKIAYEETLVSMAELEETITGQKSEQLTNQTALELELKDAIEQTRLATLDGMALELEALKLDYEAKLDLARKAGISNLELTDQYLKDKKAIEDAAAKEEIASEKATADAKAKIRDANINNISAGISLVKSLAGENKEIMAGAIIAENAMGIAKTIIATQSANAMALATPQAVATSGAAAIPVIAANNIAAGISIAASIAAAAQGLSALGKGGATGGSAPSGSGGSDGGIPAPQMMSGAFELTGGTEPEPLQAYVVSDDITDSQNSLAIIRRRATI